MSERPLLLSVELYLLLCGMDIYINSGGIDFETIINQQKDCIEGRGAPGLPDVYEWISPFGQVSRIQTFYRLFHLARVHQAIYR